MYGSRGKRKEVQTQPINRIESDRARRIAYKKRKECIMKKAMELATLCGVAVLLVVFRPSGEAETWPENPSDVKAIIDMNRVYQSSKIEGKKKAVIVDDDDIKKENSKKLLDWDMDWFNGLPRDSAKELLRLLEVKIWEIKARIDFLDKDVMPNALDLVELDQPSNNAQNTAKGKEILACHEEIGQVMTNFELCQPSSSSYNLWYDTRQAQPQQIVAPECDNSIKRTNSVHETHVIVYDTRQPQQQLQQIVAPECDNLMKGANSVHEAPTGGSRMHTTVSPHTNPQAPFPARNFIDGDGKTRSFIDKGNKATEHANDYVNTDLKLFTEINNSSQGFGEH